MGNENRVKESVENGSYSDYNNNNNNDDDGLQINDETKYYTENCAFFSYIENFKDIKWH